MDKIFSGLTGECGFLTEFTEKGSVRRENGSVRHLDIFKENAFHHEGHEGHEEVAIVLCRCQQLTLNQWLKQ